MTAPESEFLEEDLNDPEVSREETVEGIYYKRVRELAEIILKRKEHSL